MEKNKNLLISFVTILWVLIIFTLCALPSEDIPDPHWNIPQLDKVVHFGMFFILSVLLSLALEHKTSFKLRTIYGIAVGISFIYGGTIEILQARYFHRGGDIWDLAADVIGGLTGCLLYPTIKRVLQKLFK